MKNNIFCYTPCRSTVFYSDENGEIEFMSTTGIRMFKLKGIGRLIWIMLDGQHTIESIVDKICAMLSVNDKKGVTEEFLVVLKMLQQKKVVIANWNPLYKMKLSQELSQ